MISTLTDALAERGFETLTDVQQAVTAPELAEADLLVSAQTGSGKTVGFGLAIAHTLMGGDTRMGPPAAPLALIIAPTRELALQVQRELVWLYANTGAKVVSCIGGMDARDERRALERGAHIVVGTPGRLRDHITRGALDLGDIRAIVLDEADEMLDLGFREDLEFMLGAAPETRRTLLFSATVPPAIAELAKQFQRDAVRVTTISRGTQHADITYQAVQVASHEAEHAIMNLLRFHDAPTAIVFANTRAAVARLTARLANRGLAVVSISGELSQDERSHALQAMRDGRARVCVATDVAARGIDLPNLDLVIHADLPTNTEGLLHRSGRTGRAGRKGISALIVPDKAARKAERLLKWAKIEAEWIAAPSADEILALDETRLMADEVWTKPATAAEADFATRLLADRTPEQIAAACLRLYRAGLSVPEEVNTRPAPGTPKAERASFGPSVWFELSVGEDKRAEARWLLPLLCRAGNLDKSQIGKIRVQRDVSLVEIAEAAVPGLLTQLGPDGLLEDGITARRADAPPADRPRPARPAGDGPRKPAPPHDKPRAKPRGDWTPDSAPARPRPVKPAATPAVASTPDAPLAAAKAPYQPSDTPRDKAPSKSWDKPKSSPKPGPRSDGPAKPRATDGARKPRDPATHKAAWAKPGAKPGKKPYAGGKPATGPAGAKPAGAKPASRPNAADTSKRMERPGSKPTGKKPHGSGPRRAPEGGNAPPRRKK